MKFDDRKGLVDYIIFYRSRLYIAVISILGMIIAVYSLEIAFFIFICIICLVCLEIQGNAKTDKVLSEYANQLVIGENLDNKKVCSYMPLPFVVLDNKKHIRKYNSKFEDIFQDSIIIDQSIYELIPELNFNEAIYNIVINEKHYKIYIEKEQIVGGAQTQQDCILYFMDYSEHEVLNAMIKKEKTVVSLIFIDNYEEVLEGIEDVRRPLVVALINRKLSTLAQEIGGIIKSFEKDKYIMILSYEQLEIMKDNRFNILEQIREISIGNKIPITLSIGVGVAGEDLAQSMEYARIAIDLALGRGGDQAVIKNADQYNFYGGNTKEVEKNARVRARVKAYALKELIQESQRVIIMGHKNPDIDCLGSAMGVFKVCQVLQKPAHIVINEVTTNISKLYDRIVQLDEYKQGVFISTHDAEQMIDSRTLLVIVDVHKLAFVESAVVLNKSSKTVLFDHHRKSTESIEDAVLSYIEPYASSTSELITELLQYLNEKVKLKPVEADALLGGITVDTKNFTVKTGARTFEAAAFLKRSGADSVRVHTLFQNKLEDYTARVNTVKEAEIFEGNIAIAVCLSDVENPSLIVAQAADELLSISGIKSSFVMCKKGDGVSVSARSLGDINVQMVMEKLGGGGHQTVSGAQMENISIEEAKKRIKQAIYNYLKEE